MGGRRLAASLAAGVDASVSIAVGRRRALLAWLVLRPRSQRQGRGALVLRTSPRRGSKGVALLLGGGRC